MVHCIVGISSVVFLAVHYALKESIQVAAACVVCTRSRNTLEVRWRTGYAVPNLTRQVPYSSTPSSLRSRMAFTLIFTMLKHVASVICAGVPIICSVVSDRRRATSIQQLALCINGAGRLPCVSEWVTAKLANLI